MVHRCMHDEIGMANRWYMTVCTGGLLRKRSASAVLYQVTGKQKYAKIMPFAKCLDEVVMDHESSSWFHQLDKAESSERNRMAGKSDLYHALQSTLIPYHKADTSIAPAVRKNWRSEQNRFAIFVREACNEAECECSIKKLPCVYRKISPGQILAEIQVASLEEIRKPGKVFC